MKKIVLRSLCLVAAMHFSACEKDDICIEGDTALLVIGFYDADNRIQPKAVPAIRVYGVGKTTTVATFTDRTDLDLISIPLDPGTSTTQFVLVNNSATLDNAETGNLDTILFTYQVNAQFVGRACGFIATYADLEADLTSEEDNWIKEVEIVNPLVENPNTAAHVKIYH